MLKDYQALVAKAEKAVEKVSDPALKQIAFQKVLDDLIVTNDSVAEPRKTPAVKRPTGTHKVKRGSKGGPSKYLEELVTDGFFQHKKTSNEAISELADRGHHLKSSDARVALLRLCKTKMLRRKKEGKTYVYSNW
ncbi:MAG: hypothetical protein KIT76_14735 [Pseudolabrys sp.]|nr:hypothetical protein [Pseudolabrys sp.]